MSWLSDIRDSISDAADDPKNYALFGALGGLAKAAEPLQGAPGKNGYNNLGVARGLLGTIGDVAGGMVGGAKAGQEFQGRDIGNQMSQLGLEKQQAIQPLQISLLQKALGGSAPGSLSGSPSDPYMSSISRPSMADQRFAHAYDMAMAFKPEEAAGVLKTWAENTPELKGAIKLEESKNSVHETPQGPQFGINGLPGASGASAAPFSLMPPDPGQATSAAMKTVLDQREPSGIGPGAQRPPDRPLPDMVKPDPLSRSAIPPPPNPQQAAQQAGQQPPPAMQGLPSNGQPMPQIPPMQASQLQPPGGAPPPPPQQPPQGAPPMPPPQPMPPRQAAFQPPNPGDQSPGAQQLAQIIAAQQQPPQANKPPAGSTPAKDGVPLLADGKPILPSINLAYKPDPTGMPRYKTENTTTGVNQTKKFQELDAADDQEIGKSATNANQMRSRINDMADALTTGRAGTLVAQDPELANKLIAMGIITNKGIVNDVAQFQRVSADQMVELLNQLRAAAPGSRIMQAEIKGMADKLADPSQRPEAVQNILAMAQGLGDYNADLSKSWDAIGGLGNRQAEGFTLRPITFQRQFANGHAIDDYVAKARKDMPALAGTPGNFSQSNPDEIKAAYQAGKIPKDQAIKLLQSNHGFK